MTTRYFQPQVALNVFLIACSQSVTLGVALLCYIHDV